MTGNDKDTGQGNRPPREGGGKDPDWTSGLKRLYDSVVEEPLPDDLANLLSQLDADGSRK